MPSAKILSEKQAYVADLKAKFESARLIVTLISNLKRTGGKRGLATLCIGGGQSMATLIEMV